MTNSSSKPDAGGTKRRPGLSAEKRHKYFPRDACMAHLVLRGEELCAGRRYKGTKICQDHAERFASLLGWKSHTDWLKCEDAYQASIDQETAEARAEAFTLRRENRELTTEIARLRAMSPAQRRAEQRTTTDGTVYALLSGYNVKIGWTGRDLQARLREYPPSTQLLVHYPAKRGEETRIKRKFAHLRTHGNEWFPYAPQVTEWVEQMVREYGEPDATITCGPAKYEVPRPHSQRPHPKTQGWARHVS